VRRAFTFVLRPNEGGGEGEARNAEAEKKLSMQHEGIVRPAMRAEKFLSA
jgi:hypothetical protein